MLDKVYIHEYNKHSESKNAGIVPVFRPSGRKFFDWKGVEAAALPNKKDEEITI